MDTEDQSRCTYEQLQEIKRKGGLSHYYYNSCKECRYCGRVFYYKMKHFDATAYCSLQHVRDAYNKRRRDEREKIRSNRVCLFCEKKFHATRAHAKYCCESHRVLACLKRKEEDRK